MKDFALIVKNLANLKNAVIDSCSIIYMRKTGFYTFAKSTIDLITLPEIETEIQGLSPNNLKTPVDQILVEKAELYSVPVITEDKKIMSFARKRDIKYYNSIMILIKLQMEHSISQKQFYIFRNKLYTYAHYSNYVKEYADSLYHYLTASR